MKIKYIRIQLVITSFLLETSVLTHNRLGEVLSLAIDDLNNEIESTSYADGCGPIEKCTRYSITPVPALTAVKEVGFEYEHGIELMTKHLPSTLMETLEDLKQCKNFLMILMIDQGSSKGTERLIHEMKEYVDQHWSGVTLNTEPLALTSAPVIK